MKTSCPHCGQHLEGDNSLIGTTVDCPGCGTSFVVPRPTNETPDVSGTNAALGDEGMLDAANRLLERVNGNVWHAILGIFRRIGTVLGWFFSAKAARFFLLLFLLILLLVAWVGLAVGPYFAYCELADVKTDDPDAGAVVVEAIWLALFVLWGAWIGIKSYKRGALARWRQRRRARKAARTASDR